jgi:hypothetical protein
MNHPSWREIPASKTLPAMLSKTLGTGKQWQDDERTELASVEKCERKHKVKSKRNYSTKR